MSVTDLPGGVFCITLTHSLDDPDVIEHYLKEYPVATEKCIPLAIRDVLSPAAEALGFSPMPIPSSGNTMNILPYFLHLNESGKWDTSDPYERVHKAVSQELTYLLPYLLDIAEKTEHSRFTMIGSFPVDVYQNKSETSFWTAAEIFDARDAEITSLAVRTGNLDLVKMILLLGADDDSRDTALTVATSLPTCNTEMINLLLSSNPHGLGKIGGADINTNDSGPLTLAAEHSCIDVVKLLLERKANIETHQYISEGPTNPLDAAVSARREDIVRLLLSARADPTAHNNAALKDAVVLPGTVGANIVGTLLDAKANANTIDGLYLAAEIGNVETIRKLLTAGAHIDRDEPLRGAIRGNHRDAARVLLEARADISTIAPWMLTTATPALLCVLRQYGYTD